MKIYEDKLERVRQIKYQDCLFQYLLTKDKWLIQTPFIPN